MNVERVVAIFFVGLYNIGLLWIIGLVVRALLDPKE